MMVVESAMAGGRKEVALAAIAVITQMMQAHGGTPHVARPMWKRALRAMDVGVEAAASPQCLLPLQVSVLQGFTRGRHVAKLCKVCAGWILRLEQH